MATVKATTARLADRYIRCEDFAARIDGVELAPEIWAVFAKLTRPFNAAELAERLSLDIEAVNAALRRLVRRKLIRKHVLAWRDYAASAEPVAPDTNITPLAPIAPFASVATFPTQSPVVTAPPSAPRRASPIVSLRIASESPARAPAAVNLRIAATRSPAAAAPPPRTDAPAAASTDGLRLRPILEAIGAKAGGGVAGQLLVYRVFLQIPTELMHAAGIHSLSLVDDQFTLRHPELRAALADTARRHAGVDIEALAAAC